jgi:hypothetical protein
MHHTSTAHGANFCGLACLAIDEGSVMHLQLGMTQGRNLRSSPTCICVHPGSQSHLYPGSPEVTVQFPFPQATALHSEPARATIEIVTMLGKRSSEKCARRL